jgi:transcriptional regulator with XRE-family HTH domain
MSCEEAMKTIKQLREAKKWTQLDLANQLDVTPSTIYNWERGKVEPRVSQLRKLADVFGVRMDEIALLLTGSEEGKAAPVAA